MEGDVLKFLSVVQNALAVVYSLLLAVCIVAETWLWLSLDTALLVLGMDGLFVYLVIFVVRL
jgi:hypothetical protein